MAFQIIQGGNPATTSGPDGVTVLVQAPNSAGAPAPNYQGWACVGTASYGPLNVATPIGSGSDITNNFGVPNPNATYDMPTDLDIAVRSSATDGQAVRVSDGTDVAAVLKFVDGTGFATGTVTFGGTWAANTALVITVGGVAVGYTTQTSDTNNAGSIANFAAAINASAAVLGQSPSIQAVATTSTTITFTAAVQGTAGNAVTLSATTGGTITLTASGAELTGGAAPGVLATLTARYTGSFANTATGTLSQGSQYSSTSPTMKATLPFPNGTVEVFDNIIAYATAGDGYSDSAFKTNLVAAINGAPALSSLRPASVNWTAVSGSSTSSPLLSTAMTVSTPGTNGDLFTSGGATGADVAQLGNNDAVPPTGMYALTGQISGCVFWLCGNTDLGNIGSSMIAFALAQNAHALGYFPEGTGSSTAVALKQTWGLASYAMSLFKDFEQYTDQIDGIVPRTVAGSPFVGATYATTPPQISPANQQVALVTGTERVGAYEIKPYGETELELLEANGINVITNPGNVGNVFAIAHNKNSLGQNDPRGNIAYSRMTMYLCQYSQEASLGKLIGLAQSQQASDPTQVRATAKDIFDDFLSTLQSNNVIDAFQTKCDQTNNPAQQIALGVLRIDILVQYMSIVDRITAVFTGGQTLQITSSPTTLSSLPAAA